MTSVVNILISVKEFRFGLFNMIQSGRIGLKSQNQGVQNTVPGSRRHQVLYVQTGHSILLTFPFAHQKNPLTRDPGAGDGVSRFCPGCLKENRFNSLS